MLFYYRVNASDECIYLSDFPPKEEGKEIEIDSIHYECYKPITNRLLIKNNIITINPNYTPIPYPPFDPTGLPPNQVEMAYWQWCDNRPQDNIENYVMAIRLARERYVFPVINRGKLWYDKLTKEQFEELNKWYEQWLDATDTLVLPDTPSWLDFGDNLQED